MTEVTCAIIIENGKVLATQRSEKMPHPLKWEFPGGKIKKNESPVSCITREINEELAIKISVIQLLPSVQFAYESYAIKLIPLICKIEAGTITLSEHKAYRWVPVEELESIDWLDADVAVVERIRAKMKENPG